MLYHDLFAGLARAAKDYYAELSAQSPITDLFLCNVYIFVQFNSSFSCIYLVSYQEERETWT